MHCLWLISERNVGIWDWEKVSKQQQLATACWPSPNPGKN